jgi:glycosyltransferase involved in cell wall biosynthesis
VPGGPRRILYVHHRPELGGAPSSLAQLLEGLDRTRFEPEVFCPEGAAAHLFRSVGATVHVGPVAAFTHIWASIYSGRRWILLGRELIRLLPHIDRFSRVLRSGRYDLVHLNDSPLLAAGLLARRAGLPVVWHLRSALATEGRGWRARLVRGTIRRVAAASIAINENVARAFDVGAEVIPNTVDLQRFRPSDSRRAKEQLGYDPERPIVAFFGFVYPSKGYREFIQAAALLRARGVEATYLIVGGDIRGEEFYSTRLGQALVLLGLTRNYEDDAKQLVSRLGVEDCVRFVAYTPDIARLYQATDVVVAPSRGPEVGRPVLEGQASGCAVVASGTVDGAGLVIPDETGILVPRRSPDVLAAALEELVRDADLRARLGAAARRHAVACFDARTNVERVMAIYDRVLS